MKVKTSELTGVHLDFAVAQADNQEVIIGDITSSNVVIGKCLTWVGHYDGYGQEDYSPSTNWAQGGNIIEREGFDLLCELVGYRWIAISGGGTDMAGNTPLVAAMRSYVLKTLGDEVEIPEELS